MHFIYGDSKEPFTGRVAPYETWKATNRYVEHYGNLLVLQAIVNKPKSSAERLQAQKEIGKCEDKLRFWERHPNFVKEDAQRRCEELRKAWAAAK